MKEPNGQTTTRSPPDPPHRPPRRSRPHRERRHPDRSRVPDPRLDQPGPRRAEPQAPARRHRASGTSPATASAIMASKNILSHSHRRQRRHLAVVPRHPVVPLGRRDRLHLQVVRDLRHGRPVLPVEGQFVPLGPADESEVQLHRHRDDLSLEHRTRRSAMSSSSTARTGRRPGPRWSASSRDGDDVTWTWRGWDVILQTRTSGVASYVVQARMDSGSWSTIGYATTLTQRYADESSRTVTTTGSASRRATAPAISGRGRPRCASGCPEP